MLFHRKSFVWSTTIHPSASRSLAFSSRVDFSRNLCRTGGLPRHLATHSVPVAVLDIWMENMTGMELLAHLCARSPETRAIFITGHEDHAAEALVMAAGAFAFFLKPLTAAQFLSAVHRAFTTPRPAATEQPTAHGRVNHAARGRLGFGKNKSARPSRNRLPDRDRSMMCADCFSRWARAGNGVQDAREANP